MQIISFDRSGRLSGSNDNADEISAKLSNAVDLIKDEQASLESFDGVNLTMNSTMAKIVSLADPEQKLVAYDGRLGGALGFFVARFTEEREIHQYDVADQLLFAVDREAKRRPRDEPHSFSGIVRQNQRSMSRLDGAMGIATNLASRERMQASPREIEAALFMWGYNVCSGVDKHSQRAFRRRDFSTGGRSTSTTRSSSSA